MSAALLIGADRPFGDEIAALLAAEGHVVARSFADAPPVLDVLVVNNSAAPDAVRFRDMSDAQFMGTLEDQLFLLVEAVQFASPRMNAGGSIVQIVQKAHLGLWHGAHLAASSAACIAMARSMALELAGQNIRVNSVATDPVGEKWDMGDARKDVAAAIAWLAGPASALVSGETILLDRARGLQMRMAARR